MDSTPLEGKVALVTGAGRNIGRAIALALADAGAKVAVNVRASRDEGQSVVDEIGAHGGDAMLVAADITQRTDVDAMIAAIAQRFGRLDIVVNNAAIRHEMAFADLSYADWRAAQAVCVDGAFHCTQAALPLLRDSGAGTVINIGGMTAHTGARCARMSLRPRRRWAASLAHWRTNSRDFGITVNCVSPGMVDTVRKGSSATAKPAHHAESQSLARTTRTPRRNRRRRRVAGGSRRALHHRPDPARQRRRLPRRLIKVPRTSRGKLPRTVTAPGGPG